MKMKKIAALFLTTAMIASLGAACTSATAPPQSSSSSEASSRQSEQTTADSARDKVELTWYVAGSGPQADTDMVLAAINDYLADKLDCTLKIVETDFGSYDQKMQMVIASQEPFDICFTAHWSNNFYNNVNKNAFLELDGLIDQYAKELKAEMPSGGWDAARVNGKIMAVPNQQIWAMTNGVQIEKDYLNKYNVDITSIKTLRDLEPLLGDIKRDSPDMYPLEHSQQGVLDFLTFYMGYDELAGRHIPGVVLLDDASLTVVNQFELPQIQEYYKMMYEWNHKGYFRQDAATITDPTPDRMSGKVPVGFLGTMKPGNDVSATIIHGGREVISSAISPSWLTTSGITATMNAISRTSPNPERAMEFINLVNTDKTLYNLLTIGIEGKHYEKLDEDFVRPIENSGYYPNADWMYGNQFLAFFKEGQNLSDWDDTKKINNSAKLSPALGFAFDSTAVQSEIASVSAVVKEYELSLDTGSVDPEKTLPEFLAKLEGAGSKVIIAEIQKQLDSWKAAR